MEGSSDRVNVGKFDEDGFWLGSKLGEMLLDGGVDGTGSN